MPLMLWWYWLVLGLLLAALEILTPGGFFVLFFGIGALVVGMLALTGVVASPAMQWLLFSLVSLGAVLFFRAPLQRWMQAGTPSAGDVDAIRGEIAIASEHIPAGGLGRAELRGSSWTARNVGTDALGPGDRCIVSAVDGLTLSIRREGAY